MFDVGFFELLLIGMVALLVLGPKRLPHAARMAGAFLRKARMSWISLKAEVEREIEAEEIRKHVRRDAQEIADDINRDAEELRREFEQPLLPREDGDERDERR